MHFGGKTGRSNSTKWDVFVLVCMSSLRVAQRNGLLTGGWQ